MNDEEPMWEDIVPFVLQERQSQELGALRAEKIAAFLGRALNTKEVEVLLRGERAPGFNCGSCSRFFVYFDEGWRPIDDRLTERRRYSVEVSVSERAPFVTSRGGQWRMHPREDGGRVMVHSLDCVDVAAKAKSLALDVAREFGLRYLDAEWLRQFKLASLVELPLPWDVAQSLDYSEPDALNVLFCEEM